MAGNQTHGYDLVLEFAEQAYQELLSVLFDSDGFLFGTILGGLGIHLDPSIGFSVTVAFDRPSGIPAGATDTVDVQILLGDAGSTGSMRIVASVDVDSSSPDTDLTRINLKDKLWLTEIDILGHSIPGLNGLFAAFLRNNVEVIPLLPWPVDRATMSDTTIKAADARIVDDTSPADLDASAFLVTFGNGTPGNKSAFSQSFISPGGNGGLGVSFAWICRVISPLIDEALKLDGAFENCRLTHTVRVDEDHEVDLTGLSLTLDDGGFIHVLASVTKSGFCYSATGTVGAQIKISVTNGNLQVEAHVDDPNVDVDIPWYCWIAGAVIGALLGGLLFGVIGAIVGAVLIPVITFIAQEVIEAIVNDVAARIAAELNKITPNVDIPAVGFNLIFSSAFIDDVQIDTHVKPIDSAPVRATGTILVPNGAAVDLDSGKIGPRDMPGGDIAVLGASFLRQVEAVCGARWARTGLTSFGDLYRAAVYGYSYAAPNPVPLSDLAHFNPLGQIFGNPYDETLRIYGVRTNEGRWAAIQAVEVTDEAIRFRYITWEKAQATVQIVGAFTCDVGPFGGVVTAGTAVFVPSAVVGGRPVQTAGSGAVLAGASTSTAPTEPDPCVDLRRAVAALTPAPVAGTTPVDPVTTAILALPPDQRRIGRWVGPIVNRTNRFAIFDAKTDGMGPGQRARWQLNGSPLEVHSHGDVDLGGGAKVHYRVRGKRLELTMDSDHAVELLLAVTVVDDRGDVASAERCIHFEPTCSRTGRVTPPWADYQTAWLTNFGVVEVAPPPPPVVIT